jgi:hypothetical protein
MDVRPGVSSTHVKYATYAINDVIRFFSDNYRIALRKKLRIILVPDEKEYAAVLGKDFGYPPGDAQKLSKTTGGMARDGQVEYVFAAKARKNASMDIFMHTACHEIIHWYQYTAGGNKSAQLKWLLEGTADLIGYHIVDANIKGAMEKFRRKTWEKIKSAPAVPSLRELYSRRDWLAAMDRYGGGVVYGKAFLAVTELAQRKGINAVFNYFLNLKTYPVPVAFERAFGMNLHNFERFIDQKIRK